MHEFTNLCLLNIFNTFRNDEANSLSAESAPFIRAKVLSLEIRGRANSIAALEIVKYDPPIEIRFADAVNVSINILNLLMSGPLTK